MWRTSWMWLLLACQVAAGEDSRPLSAPRVVSNHVADAYSMKTFAQFPRWRELQGDALAYEVYKYLVDTRTGIFHMNVVAEGLDQLGEFNQIRDPVKIINVYGYGYCGIFGPTMAGVCEDMGIGPARMLTLPLWNHVATETFYDDRWHYLDVDVRAVFRRDDGTLASIEEARRDPSLWRDRGPLFFPNDPLDRTRKVYEDTPVETYYGFNQSGHTMDYVLRPGERLTRWWKPQGGRWRHLPLYQKNDWLRRLIESEPRGPKPNHRHFTVHNYANGRFIYTPNLSSHSRDFDWGVYDHKNVRTTNTGVTLQQPGEGYAVFEVRSPYVIVPLVGQLDTTDDDREAAVVEMDAAGASLDISLDNGLTWQDVEVDTWPATVDLTQHVSGRYGYLLRVRLRGKPDQAVLRRLKMTTWVQVAPASLPALRMGMNRLEVHLGDDHGLETRVVEVRSQASQPGELLKYLVEAPEDYDPGRRTSKIRGPITVRVPAPPGCRIAWFTACGQFRTHQQKAAEKTANSIAYAVGEPRDFRIIYEADVPTYAQHWHYNAAREVRLEEPAEIVFVRYVGDPAINNFVVYAHCVDERLVAISKRSPIQVTHIWNDDSTRNAQSRTFNAPGKYEIPGKYEPQFEYEPENVSIELAVPSSGTTKGTKQTKRKS